MMTSMHRHVLVLCALLSLSAAAQDDREPAPQPESGMQKQGLTFLDSRLFDSRLSQELSTGKNRVEVDISGRVPLSAIPPRLDRWISRVGEEGNVEMRESPARTRAIFALVPLLFQMVAHMSEERMLEPAKDYNATVYYKRDANGDTILDRIVFSKKGQ